MGDAVTGLHGVGLAGQIHQAHADLTPVVAVDDAHAVGQAYALFNAQSAAGEHQGHVLCVRQGDGNPRGDQRALQRRQRHGLIHTGAKIHGGGAGGGKTGGGDVAPDAGGQGLDFQFHVGKDSYSENDMYY